MALINQSLSENSPFVLLVEDNLVALRLVETITTQAGCRFIAVSTGEEALDLAKTLVFDLIITDLGLPGISGIELTHQIRQWEQSLSKKQVPIIGLTAHSLQETEMKGLQLGMNKVLTKPIYLHIMQELIRQFV